MTDQDGGPPPADDRAQPPKYPGWSTQDWRTFVITLEATFIGTVAAVAFGAFALGIVKELRKYGILGSPLFWLWLAGTLLSVITLLAYNSQELRRSGRLSVSTFLTGKDEEIAFFGEGTPLKFIPKLSIPKRFTPRKLLIAFGWLGVGYLAMGILVLAGLAAGIA